uniref:P-loop containing nucleoside triphosphate hydrolase protein n=1 Tax=Mycena chlorophos TaxID=658473 RepID=A0ABQ0L3P0_MYCCL|nr:predicted protein [Mycena chlorophos]
MATYLTIAHHLFTTFGGGSFNATSFSGAGNSTDTNGALSTLNIRDFSSIVAFLFSVRALTDWLKLIVFGGALETLRRLAFALYRYIVASFWITASFHQDDSSYDWMMVWLSKQPNYRMAREVDVSTRSFGLTSSAVVVDGEEAELSLLSGRKIGLLPSPTLTYSFWYKGHYIAVNRIQTLTGWRGSKEETLELNILARSHRILNELLLEAKKTYNSAKDQSVSIYVSDSSNSWRHVASRPKRSLSSIILDPGVAELLVDDARDFLESKSWYSARGIPFRRGYLLYGAPGSGKTSLIGSIAGELSLDVYIVSLSRSGLDDAGLSELITGLPEKCICLMEDIDCAFSGSINRKDEPAPVAPVAGPSGPPGPDGVPPPPVIAAAASPSRLSLSGLLNALDGVAAQEGRILYATTNKYSSLDDALCRPGRMDLHVEFKLASRYQAKRLFVQFYLPVEEVEEAKAKLVVDEKAKQEQEEEGEGELEETESTSSTSESTAVDDGPTYFGTSHREHAPKLRPKQIALLAEQFADAIPEREVSMASLQGYLMTYKIRPQEAASSVKKWVESEREAKTKREDGA